MCGKGSRHVVGRRRRMLLRVLDDKKFLKFDEPSWVLTVGGGVLDVGAVRHGYFCCVLIVLVNIAMRC